MKTTNLKQTSVAKPRKWFQRRRRWHDPRVARPEASQFRDQKSRLHLREFAKDSRFFAPFAPGANRAPQFFSLVNRVLRTPLAFGKLMPRLTKGVHQSHETDTWNIAGRRSWISNDALDPCTARPRNSVRDISAEGAFQFLRGVLAAAVCLFAPSRTRVT